MPAKPLRIALLGATGRMGREISALAQGDGRFLITAGISGENRSELDDALAEADCAVDFSLPAAAPLFAKAAAKAGIPLVVGTTGLNPAQLKALKTAAKKIPVLYSPNMSLGMNLLFELTKIACAALKTYDAGISETHHTQKKDAPSGSAKRLQDAAKAGNGRGASIVSLRLGEAVGEHTLYLAGPGERLEFTHRAESRAVFARGALEAALWLAGRKKGFYSMKDALGL